MRKPVPGTGSQTHPAEPTTGGENLPACFLCKTGRFRCRRLPDSVIILAASGIIGRIRDDCVPFDPGERNELTESGDPVRNIGIKMVYRVARDVEYQSVMGLNVLTIRI